MPNFLFVTLVCVFLKHNVLSEDVLAELFEIPIQVETVAEDESFVWIESPLWSETGQFLLFSGVKWLNQNNLTSGMIWRWDETNGLTKFLEDAGIVGPGSANIVGWKEGGPNGMVWGWNGDGEDLLFCQHGKKRIARVNISDVIDGTIASDKVSVVVDSFGGNPLNSPNDMTLVDGKLFFTDPPYGLQMNDDVGLETAFTRMTQPVAGVYVISSDGAPPELILNNIGRPNGIAISNAGNAFFGYTNGSDPHFRMYKKSSEANKHIGDSFEKLPSTHRIDQAVNPIDFPLNDGVTAYKNVIFGAGPGGVYVLNGANGQEIGYIRVDDLVSNVETGGGYLWITANQKLLRVKFKGDDIQPSSPTKDPFDSATNQPEQSNDNDDSGALNNYITSFLFLSLFNLIL